MLNNLCASACLCEKQWYAPRISDATPCNQKWRSYPVVLTVGNSESIRMNLQAKRNRQSWSTYTLKTGPRVLKASDAGPVQKAVEHVDSLVPLTAWRASAGVGSIFFSGAHSGRLRPSFHSIIFSWLLPCFIKPSYNRFCKNQLMAEYNFMISGNLQPKGYRWTIRPFESHFVITTWCR